jgi:16S rRNA (guanine527-N7)-methyltransferase
LNDKEIRADIINGWSAEYNGEPLTDEQIRLFAQYQACLLEANEYMNLTTITSPEEIAVKHFIDSLSLLTWIKPNKPKVLDIGTGAGFPGLVLKIIKPEIDLTLMDSLRKRILFLIETADRLGLANVHCVHIRAEEAAKKPEYKSQYDIVTARAVARLTKLAGYALPFLKKGGLFLAMKGPDAGEELNEAKPHIKKYGGIVREVTTVDISSAITHTVVVVEKA